LLRVFEKEQPVKVRMPAGQVIVLGQQNAVHAILQNGGELVKE
jgi:hypothetical protein